MISASMWLFCFLDASRKNNDVHFFWHFHHATSKGCPQQIWDPASSPRYIDNIMTIILVTLALFYKILSVFEKKANFPQNALTTKLHPCSPATTFTYFRYTNIKEPEEIILGMQL